MKIARFMKSENVEKSRFLARRPRSMKFRRVVNLKVASRIQISPRTSVHSNLVAGKKLIENYGRGSIFLPLHDQFTRAGYSDEPFNPRPTALRWRPSNDKIWQLWNPRLYAKLLLEVFVWFLNAPHKIINGKSMHLGRISSKLPSPPPIRKWNVRPLTKARPRRPSAQLPIV